MARWLCCLYEVLGRFLSLRGGGQVGILCTQKKGKDIFVYFFYLVGVGFLLVISSVCSHFLFNVVF